jgi:hypothetical protein
VAGFAFSNGCRSGPVLLRSRHDRSRGAGARQARHYSRGRCESRKNSTLHRFRSACDHIYSPGANERDQRRTVNQDCGLPSISRYTTIGIFQQATFPSRMVLKQIRQDFHAPWVWQCDMTGRKEGCGPACHRAEISRSASTIALHSSPRQTRASRRQEAPLVRPNGCE